MGNRKLLFVFAIASTSTFLVSCKSFLSRSKSKGHYENFSEAELQKFKGKVRVIPEYEASSGVIISVSAVEEFQLYPLLESLKSHPTKPSVILPMVTNYYPLPPQRLTPYLASDHFKLFSIMADQSAIDTDISWTRDWAPWTASYQPDSSTYPQAQFIDLNYYEARNLADELPQRISESMKIPRLSIPIRTEGGNFMINNGGDCIMTEGVIARENAIANYDALLTRYKEVRESTGSSEYDAIIARFEMLKTTSKIYQKPEIETFFRDYAGCLQIIWLPPSPADVNQHVDLFAKFLSDKDILVMELTDKTISTLPNTSNPAAALDVIAARSFAKSVQAHLDTVATTLTDKGFRVIRAPLPATLLIEPESGDDRSPLPLIKPNTTLAKLVQEGQPITLTDIMNAGLDVHMRSYANSLIMKPLAYVPRFIKPRSSSSVPQGIKIVGGDGTTTSIYPDAVLLKEYEQSVEAAYAQGGFKVIWIDSDHSVMFKGSIHCLTQQIGLVPTP